MRGISKPWPPTDVYPDDHEPASFREAEEAFLAELQEARDQGTFARSEFNGLAKQKLRAVMYREQRSLCIYCEREITEGYPPPTIEHWRPLSIEPRLALHWNNLYLSCTWSQTCDTAKGDRPLRWDESDPHMPWPVDLPYEDFVGFTSPRRDLRSARMSHCRMSLAGRSNSQLRIVPMVPEFGAASSTSTIRRWSPRVQPRSTASVRASRGTSRTEPRPATSVKYAPPTALVRIRVPRS